MKIKTTYETDYDVRIYATDPGWVCGLGDNEEIQLGVYAHLLNTFEYDCCGEEHEDFPIECDFSVVVHNPALNAKALDCLGLDEDYLAQFAGDPEAHAEAVRELLQEYAGSGVPVGDMLVHGIRGAGEANALNALLEGLEGVKVIPHPRPFPGGSTEVVRFASWEVATEFARRVFERAFALMGLIGFTLDKRVNMVGADGWSMIQAQVEGEDWNPMPNFG